ncbi:MAG: virulence protein RhuM/Fic/DOC family protein [Desulfobacula sp.]|nr:virulence protein RhuM/Fic/DOC family protein [Desulfobacula sp.]
MESNTKVVIYQSKDGSSSIDVNLEDNTVWLNQKQMAELFDRDYKTISKHINNVYREGELDKNSTVAKYATVQDEGNRTVTREIDHYNLDVIISVGYRVKSVQGTQFRIWANKILKEYLVQGFAVNERRLSQKAEQLVELKKIVALQEKVISAHKLKTGEAEGLIQIISAYSKALSILDDYDYQRLQLPKSKIKEKFKISYDAAKIAIQQLAEKTGATELFGAEKDDSFKGSLENIYQTFEGKDLYPSLEMKAAHLLYFVVKNHSFVDGNKRIAAFLFIWFLEKNNLLYDKSGLKILSDNALVAITLMLAESNPEDKNTLIKVIVKLFPEY